MSLSKSADEVWEHKLKVSCLPFIPMEKSGEFLKLLEYMFNKIS